MSNSNLRVPPHSEEAERGVIGSVLLDPTRLDGLNLKPSDFYDRKHQVLWEAIAAIEVAGSWDVLSLGQTLKDTGKLDAVGGYDALVSLQDSAITPAHSQHYAKTVASKAELRRQLEIIGSATDRLYNNEDSADYVISSMMAYEVEEAVDIGNIIKQWKDARNGTLQTIPTPYPDLDRHTGGLRIGMPCVFTGRSKAGKSMFLAMWYNYLGQQGIPTLVFPFEDDYHITITRMAANLGQYKWGKIENGGEWSFLCGKKEWVKVTDKEMELAERCLREVEKYPVYFYDGSMPPTKLMGKVARYKKKHGIKIFFVDGAKDFEKPSGKYNDVGFDEECSQMIKKVCKKQHVAGVVVHHLTKVQDHELITVNNVRGSGNIIGDSRSVYALQSLGLRESGVMVNEDDFGNVTTRRFECLASNHGGVGAVLLDSDLNKCQFYREHTRGEL